MSSLKITLHLPALCLLLSITTKVSGKPNPRHLLIETEEQAKKTADYKEPGTDYNKAENNYDYPGRSMNGNSFGDRAQVVNVIKPRGGGNIASSGPDTVGGGWGCRCGVGWGDCWGC